MALAIGISAVSLGKSGGFREQSLVFQITFSAGLVTVVVVVIIIVVIAPVVANIILPFDAIMMMMMISKSTSGIKFPASILDAVTGHFSITTAEVWQGTSSG